MLTTRMVDKDQGEDGEEDKHYENNDDKDRESNGSGLDTHGVDNVGDDDEEEEQDDDGRRR